MEDKAQFVALAAARSLPVPPTVVLDQLLDPPDELLDLGLPLIIKPTARDSTWVTAVGSSTKALRIETKEELLEFWPRLRGLSKPAVAQECIPGPRPPWSATTSTSTRRARSRRSHRSKIRTIPAEYGHTSSLTITDDPEVARLGREVCAALDLRGVAKLDFKYGPDGRLYLFEINARHALGTPGRAGRGEPCGDHVRRPHRRPPSGAPHDPRLPGLGAPQGRARRPRQRDLHGRVAEVDVAYAPGHRRVAVGRPGAAARHARGSGQGRRPGYVGRDPGLSMRIGLLSDVHANLFALRAAVARLRAEGVDAWVCAGDLVGYGAPQRVRRDDRRAEPTCVAGNHELMLLEALPVDRAGWLARRSIGWTRGVVRADVLAYLAALPRTATVAGMAVAHGSPGDPEEYVVQTSGLPRCSRLSRPNSCSYWATRTARGCTGPASAASSPPVQQDHRDRPTCPSRRTRGTWSILEPSASRASASASARARFALVDLTRAHVRFFAEPYDVAAAQAGAPSAAAPRGRGARSAWTGRDGAPSRPAPAGHGLRRPAPLTGGRRAPGVREG